MSVQSHREDAPRSVRIALVTISDSRTPDTDTAGQAGKALIAAAGHALGDYRIVRDEPEEVRALVQSLVRDHDVVVTCGGTGITARDSTFEALSALMSKQLPGFGELFRALSYAEIGAAAMLSRAVGGLVGNTVVFCCPGSTAAVSLALGKLVLPEAGHLVREARR